ncbi:MAG: hypothetical protein ACKPKO_28600, partial [Candidatus Fonsibacter sp.]
MLPLLMLSSLVRALVLRLKALLVPPGISDGSSNALGTRDTNWSMRNKRLIDRSLNDLAPRTIPSPTSEGTPKVTTKPNGSCHDRKAKGTCGRSV